MKQIHFIAQGKGGVGKSFIATLLAQYLHNNTDEEIHCYDTDPVNQTFSRYKSLNVELIHILNEHNNIDSRKFDDLIESLIERDGIAVIDNGAATFIPLMSYMNENNVIEILQDSGATVFFHVPIQGGQALEDTMLGLASIIDRLPVQVMVWLNHHKGEIVIDGKKFNQFRVYEAAKICHYHAQTIRDWIKNGQLSACKVGRAYVIADSNLDAFIKHLHNENVQASLERRGENICQYGLNGQKGCCNPVVSYRIQGFLRIESFEPKKCLFCTSKNTKKNGYKRNKQNYLCKDCKRQFVGGNRLNNAQLWHEYTAGKQSYKQLAEHYGCSIRTIQRRLDSVQFEHAKSSVKNASVVMDTTYFGRHFGLMVFMDNATRSILHYDFVRYETNALYIQGIRAIKEKGIIIQNVTCDGRRGLIGSFNVPTQMCQFHQQQIITRYLTRKPQHAASQSLRNMALQLPKTTKADFEKMLDEWYFQHGEYLNERSINAETGKTWYTHKRLRSAYRSLRNNLEWLFVYQEKRAQKIANTTNALESLFSELKRQLNCHKGLNMQRKLRFIKDFLDKRPSK